MMVLNMMYSWDRRGGGRGSERRGGGRGCVSGHRRFSMRKVMMMMMMSLRSMVMMWLLTMCPAAGQRGQLRGRPRRFQHVAAATGIGS